MITTVTLNPSLDYHVEVAGFALGKTNRVIKETLYPGGKGINVSVILSRLGIANRCILLISGHTGETLEKMVREQLDDPELFPIQNGMTRVNIKLDGGSETEINGMGPIVTPEEREALCQRLSSEGLDGPLVLAGSMPRGIPADFYAHLVALRKEKNQKTVVDASGEAFRLAAEAGPYLVKPNLAELSSYYGVTIRKEEAAEYAKKLQQKTGGYVLLSMGKDGAILAAPGGLWREAAPQGKVVSATGSGDSMVAGFLAAQEMFETEAEWLRFAVACGSASAFSEWLAEKEEIIRIYDPC